LKTNSKTREDKMQTEHPTSSGPWAVVEGPRWGDASFYAQWMLSVAELDKLVQRLRTDDEVFQFVAQQTVELSVQWDFGLEALLLLGEFAEGACFVLDLASERAVPFTVMAELGFFVQTGAQYQMTLPRELSQEAVKTAYRRLAATDDHLDGVHPERLMVSVDYQFAKSRLDRLAHASEQIRLREREALLDIALGRGVSSRSEGRIALTGTVAIKQFSAILHRVRSAACPLVCTRGY
jgi:hypothetical protein